MTYDRLFHKTDEELVKMACTGHEDAINVLIKRYRILVEKISSKYYRTDATIDDIIQEGLIGLYQSILCFSPEANVTFHSFASLVVKRKIKTYIRSGHVLKHSPHYQSISLQKKLSWEDKRTIEECIINRTSINPVDYLLEKEKNEELSKFINKRLSQLEKTVLYFRLKGLMYKNIAMKLGVPVKSIDNATGRIKTKGRSIGFINKL